MKHYRKTKMKRRKSMLFLMCLIFLIVLVYIFLFSPLFKIKAVEVFGNREVSSEEVKNSFNYGNIFLTTESKVRDDLIKIIPKISDLEISKNLIKRSVKLTIEERERLGITCQISEQGTENNEQVGDCFYIDKKGVIFEDAPQTSGSLILLIKDYSQREFYLGKKIFEQRIVDFISQARQGLSSEIGLIALDFNVLSFPPKDLKVMTSEGWYIIFDLEGDIKNQLRSIGAALNEKIKEEERKNLEYIDLRIENRIYYK